ncbi:MAG TPA: heme-binding protein [Blastocatellia bacterium]|nr:heme-binding protein [Blastocatellia bacterium]
MRARFRLSVRSLVLAVIASLSFGAIVVKQSIEYFQASAAAQTAVASVNAASFLSPISPSTITAAFGTNLATQTVVATTLPLPTVLGGVRVRVMDGNNVQHDAPIFFVSPQQVNYLLPDQAASGNGRIMIDNGAGVVSQGTLQIANVSLGVFTVTASGSGIAAAVTTTDGVNFFSTVNPDGSPRAVLNSTAWRPNFLVLFGTGFTRATDLRVSFGGVEATPTFVGATPGLSGLAQINVAVPLTAPPGVLPMRVTANGQVSNTFQILITPTAFPPDNTLSVADVQLIIAQAVAKAEQIGLKATIAVVDEEANVLGIFKMAGARSDVLVGSTDIVTGRRLKQPPIDPDGLEGLTLPLAGSPPGLLSDGAALAAISKAGTAAFFTTQGSSITTRTASFIIQENFPPGVSSQMGGPLFGVQFSSLPCSDIRQPNLPLGLSGDPGGVGIYKNGFAVGGVGIEGDGFYSVDTNLTDFEQPPEELTAIAAIKGYRPPALIQIDTMSIDGMTLPYVNVNPQGDGPAPQPFANLAGTVVFPIRAQPASRFSFFTLGQVPGRVDPRFFPFRGSAISSLTVNDVTRILTQGAQAAYRMRAAIRQPVPQPVEVNIFVVDTSGAVLGAFSTIDAPPFGFDVAAQKARTANFFSLPTAGAQLRAAGFGKFVDAAAADGVFLDGKFAFSNRAMGFLARPFFPDGINGTVNGPFSKPINIWSPFNDGLQVALVKGALASILTGGSPSACTAIPSLPHGIQIFAGSVPLFKNGVLVGAVGVSGDGIDQDDLTAATASMGFETPDAMRADQLTPRGVRLPFVKFPRHPNFRDFP